MKVNGIIAEYNPFHSGHKYQLEESLRLTGADYTVIVMSGDFVQRGAPALAAKRLRAAAALSCGADLVLELPVLYACASAEYFAAGAAALLDRLGIVTHLCFGSECGDTTPLAQAAAVFAEETPEYRSALKSLLKKGLSYPAARVRALASSSGLPENGADLLSSPNNILGIEYIRALHSRRSSIIPATVKRLGDGYRDALPSGSCRSGEASLPCSALAIRRLLQNGCSSLPDGSMPPEAAVLLKTWLKENRLMRPDDLSSILYYKLLSEKKYGYEKYLDMTGDLNGRIRNHLGEFIGFEVFCDLLKTKNLTYARISRCLLHILLGITKEDMAFGQSIDYTPYARVLGFRKAAQPLLGAVKAHASIPLVTKTADAKKILTADAARILEQDIFASTLYQSAIFLGTGRVPPNEISLPPVIL